MSKDTELRERIASIAFNFAMGFREDNADELYNWITKSGPSKTVKKTKKVGKRKYTKKSKFWSK
jgi:hypothetical protein